MDIENWKIDRGEREGWCQWRCQFIHLYEHWFFYRMASVALATNENGAEQNCARISGMKLPSDDHLGRERNWRFFPLARLQTTLFPLGREKQDCVPATRYTGFNTPLPPETTSAKRNKDQVLHNAPVWISCSLHKWNIRLYETRLKSECANTLVHRAVCISKRLQTAIIYRQIQKFSFAALGSIRHLK